MRIVSKQNLYERKKRQYLPVSLKDRKNSKKVERKQHHNSSSTANSTPTS